MFKFVLAALSVSCLPALAFGQCAPPGYEMPNCAPPPACACPVCQPQYYPHRPEAAPLQPEGHYVRTPEAGEFAGESQSIGIRGFALKLPSLSLELPELRLPSLIRYRRNPEMHVESARAPWMPGRPAEFRHAPHPGAPEGAERPVQPPGIPESVPFECAPPPYVPACTTATERRLLNELAQKEEELDDIRRRFEELEAMIGRIAEARGVAVNDARAESSIDQESGVMPVAYAAGAKRPDAAIPGGHHVHQSPPISRPVRR